ncbi:MAG TPA: CPBP family intramembrane glutamic endopeptidase [Oculatellaceae cyanobacterium]
MSELVIVVIFAILGLMAHGARKHRWLEWFIRVVIFITFGSELFWLFVLTPEERSNRWLFGVFTVCTLITGLVLLKIAREGMSKVLSAINSLVSGGMIRELLRRSAGVKAVLLTDPIFLPDSIPHLNGLFLYASTILYLLSNMNPGTDMGAPSMPLPIPVDLGSLFNYNWVGLMLLSICGAGIFVARKPKEVFVERLGFKRPTPAQIGIGLGLILFSFTYDLIWSLYTHNTSGDLGGKLLNYNAGTFGVVGGLAPSVVLALATAFCAGMGEETLIRGALQPMIGIVPAAVLHGVLHGQFAHAPIFILQVAGWSTCMGIVKRYTNTTTTIIGHAGFNLVTVFLFSFNP